MNVRNTESPIIATPGMSLPNGGVIELVSAPLDRSRPNLLVFEHGKVEIGPSFMLGRHTYEAVDLEGSLQKALRLPPGVDVFGSTAELFGKVLGTIAKFCPLSEDEAELTTYFVFASWLPELTTNAPFLFVNCPPTETGSTLIQLLDALTMHAVKLRDTSHATFASLPMDLKLTLIFDVVKPSLSLLHFLRDSNRQGFCRIRGRKALDPYCSKVLLSRQPLCEPSALDFPLQITLPPDSTPIRHLGRHVTDEIAAELQPQLLNHRLMLLTRPMPVVQDAGLMGPSEELFRTLAIGVGNDPELTRGLLEALRERDIELKGERSGGAQAVTLEALLAVSHDAGRKSIRALELGDLINEILLGRHEDPTMNPERTGWILKSLGFRTVPIGSLGKGVYVDESTRERIHILARKFGIRSLVTGVSPTCKHCDGHNVGNSKLGANSLLSSAGGSKVLKEF